MYHIIRTRNWVLTSSFSMISAKVRYIRSVFRFKHSCRIMRLPRVSRSLPSVLNNSRRFIMNALKYVSSELEEICARSCKSCLITSSELSDSVFRSAGNVPSSIAKIYILKSEKNQTLGGIKNNLSWSLLV